MVEKPGPILVTGANSGIGKAVTELLSEQGHIVYATARRPSELDSLARLPGVTPLRLDVTREVEVRQAVLDVQKQGHGLYGLVNNAGITDIAPTVESSVEDFARVIDVNLYGIHRMVQAFFPLLRESRGRIVNISSINGVAPFEFGAAYSASKFALEAYSEVLRAELSEFGIRVCVIEPGGFRSAIVTNMFARKPTASTTGVEASPFRDQCQKFLSDFAGTPEKMNRTIYPEPRPVAEAVAKALFAEKSRLHIMVGNKEETDWAIVHTLKLLNQLNQSSAQPWPPEAILARLGPAPG
jgi:NAD(P)-dependent dehydrogenase (short-subunit alcohol dehydrogenase family)